MWFTPLLEGGCAGKKQGLPKPKLFFKRGGKPQKVLPPGGTRPRAGEASPPIPGFLGFYRRTPGRTDEN